MAHLTPERLETAKDIAHRHPGKCPLLLCLIQPEGQAMFIETHEVFRVNPSRQLQEEVDDAFGEDTYYVKVDTTLPERAQRQWQRRDASNGAGEG
jgi:hypothetical protein